MVPFFVVNFRYILWPQTDPSRADKWSNLRIQEKRDMRRRFTPRDPNRKRLRGESCARVLTFWFDHGVNYRVTAESLLEILLRLKPSVHREMEMV